MPVRSLHSRVLKWPDAATVLEALRSWAQRAGGERPELLRVGCFGSYARGDWAVGSDLDVILLVREAAEPFARRAAAWDLTSLPVPCDVLVYTPEEWTRTPLARAIQPELVWVWQRDPATR